MARKIKLTDSVSISELKHMREVEGLSNAEIAKRVGCAVSTVIDHIGKQPKWMTKRNQMAGLRKTKQLPTLPEKELPDMPRESFKERCERMMAQAEEKVDINDKLQSKRGELHTLEAIIPSLAGDLKVEALQNAQQLLTDIAELKKLQTEDKPTVTDVPCTEPNKPKMHYNYLTPPKEGWGDDDEEEACTEADKAREAHTSLMEKLSDSYTLHGLVDELVMVFGHNAAVNFLKCRLYEYGFSAFLLANREDYVKELNRLCGIEEDLHD